MCLEPGVGDPDVKQVTLTARVWERDRCTSHTVTETGVHSGEPETWTEWTRPDEPPTVHSRPLTRPVGTLDE